MIRQWSHATSVLPTGHTHTLILKALFHADPQEKGGPGREPVEGGCADANVHVLCEAGVTRPSQSNHRHARTV
jgi:hypothetical protein